MPIAIPELRTFEVRLRESGRNAAAPASTWTVADG